MVLPDAEPPPLRVPVKREQRGEVERVDCLALVLLDALGVFPDRLSHHERVEPVAAVHRHPRKVFTPGAALDPVDHAGRPLAPADAEGEGVALTHIIPARSHTPD